MLVTPSDRSGVPFPKALSQKRRNHSSDVLDQPQSLCPGFRGPTSSSFIFEVANDSLKRMGVSPEVPKGDTGPSQEGTLSTPPYQQSERGGPSFKLFPHDALNDIGEGRTLQLCQIYDESFGVILPVLDMSRVLFTAHLVFASPGAFLSSEAGTSPSGPVDDDPTFGINMLKLICAVALASAGCGEYAKAQRLYDDIEDAAEAPIWDAMGLKGLQYLTLVVSMQCSNQQRS